jgi:hypothetical protein
MMLEYRGMNIILRPWNDVIAATWHLPGGQEAGVAEALTVPTALALAKAQIDHLLGPMPAADARQAQPG